MDILEQIKRRRIANAAALASVKSAAESGDLAAIEKWAAIVEFVRGHARDNPGWLLTHSEWATATGTDLPVPEVPAVGDEAGRGPEAPAALPGGTGTEP